MRSKAVAAGDLSVLIHGSCVDELVTFGLYLLAGRRRRPGPFGSSGVSRGADVRSVFQRSRTKARRRVEYKGPLYRITGSRMI
jgi:hypothetical protein